MAKPTSLPRWATDVGAMITEPTEGKKDSGWAPLEKPPAQYFNWWQKVVYLWAVYLDGLTNEALTWAAKHTFAAGLASGVAPTAATDVVRKNELDSEAASRAAVDAAETAARVAGDNAGMAYTNAKFPALAWTGLTFSSPWGNANASNPFGYWKDAAGVVHLRGAVIPSSSTSDATPWTDALPLGYRPAWPRPLLVGRSTESGFLAPIYLNVNSNGILSLHRLDAGQFASTEAIILDGISFVAEQ